MAGEDDDDDELAIALVVLCVVVIVGVVTTEVEEDAVGIVGAVTGGALGGGAGTAMFGSCMIFTSAQFLTWVQNKNTKAVVSITMVQTCILFLLPPDADIIIH